MKHTKKLIETLRRFLFVNYGKPLDMSIMNSIINDAGKALKQVEKKNEITADAIKATHEALKVAANMKEVENICGDQVRAAFKLIKK